MPIPNKVAVSYSWKEENNGSNQGAVDSFCARLRGAGVAVVRDVDRLKHGDSLSKFMRGIGASDFLCVFLSDPYLRSPNCMYELLVAWQSSKDSPDEFRNRVKVWVMPGAESIRDLAKRLEYANHWQLEVRRLEKLVQEAATSVLSGQSLEEFKRMKEFVHHTDAILQFFADTLSPSSSSEFEAWVSRQFPSDSAEQQLAEVYKNTITEMESVLNRLPVLRQFISMKTQGLIQQEGGAWKLARQVRERQFNLCAHLKNISDQLAAFRGQSADWRGLGDFAGGLAVLCLDRKWVLAQRDQARRDSAEFPGDANAIDLGGGRRAVLLHLVTAALADGRARLEHVFGKPPIDPFTVPDAPALMRGVGLADHQHEVKLHFIRFVLGPETPVDEGDAKQMEILFKRTKDIMTAAFRDDHTPYAATGESFRKLKETIRRDLKVEDLLLIHPSGDDPGGLITDYVRVLRFLGKIFDAVSDNFRPA